MLKIGYNTNGFGCHALETALEIIAEHGYAGVAITLDHCALNPWDPDLTSQIKRVDRILKATGLSCVVETGARFLLNPRLKHEPTLISASAEGRRKRLDFLTRALAIAGRLDAQALSFWSGVKASGIGDEQAWEWLIGGCRALAHEAQAIGVPLAFEPEPGMFVENLDQYEALRSAVGHQMFALTLDLGHVFLTEHRSPGDCLRHYRNDIHNIHIEDMAPGVHRHLFFGEGQMVFAEIFEALHEIDFRGLINVELSRHSHRAVETAAQARNYLDAFV